MSQTRSGRRLLASDGGEEVSDYLNFGPDGLQLKKDVSLRLPFGYQSASPFRNRLFELAIWRLDVNSGEWERKPYPEGMDATTAVVWDADPPYVMGTTKSFSAYAVRATRRVAAPLLAAIQTAQATTTPLSTFAATTLGARPQRLLTTPTPVIKTPSVPFECFNHWVCLGGVAVGGFVAMLVLAYFAIVAVHKCRRAQAAKKALAKLKPVEEEESDEVREARLALAAEQDAARALLQSKYKVEPERDPESLGEAKGAYAIVNRVVGTPMQRNFDPLRVDWLKAHISYWAASEGLQSDAAKKKDVEFCLQNNLLELENDVPKYAVEDLQTKNIVALRQMCESDEVLFTEPFLFGKKAYFVGLLKEVRTGAGGMREFVSKKLNKIQVVELAMAYQQERITHFKNILEDAKIKAAQRELDDEAKLLEAKFKKLEFEKQEAKNEAVYAEKRAENESKREVKREAKLQRQIEELKMQRAKDKEAAKNSSADATMRVHEEALKQALHTQQQLDIETRTAAAKVVRDAQAQAQFEAAEAAKERQFGANNSNFDHSRAGTWIVVWKGHVRVRDIPSDESGVLEYKYCRERMEGAGTITNEKGEEWLKLAAPHKGYILIDSRPSAAQSCGVSVKPQGAVTAASVYASSVVAEVQSANVEFVTFHVGYNGYDMAQWYAELSDLELFQKLAGHTLVPATSDWNDGQLYRWAEEQRKLFREGVLDKDCIDALNSMDFVWISNASRAGGQVAGYKGIGNDDDEQLIEQVMVVRESATSPLMEVASMLVFANGQSAPQYLDPMPNSAREDTPREDAPTSRAVSADLVVFQPRAIRQAVLRSLGLRDKEPESEPEAEKAKPYTRV